jgi:hypothetical protein
VGMPSFTAVCQIIPKDGLFKLNLDAHRPI